MLFSNQKVAKFIDDGFEPAWQSVRAVPRITIDFGNGKRIERTLHGNIATYICTADGVVVDVLPGIYSPNSYMRELSNAKKIAMKAQELDAHDRVSYLSDYHLHVKPAAATNSYFYDEADAKPILLAGSGSGGAYGAGSVAHVDVSKRVIEMPVKSLLQSTRLIEPMRAVSTVSPSVNTDRLAEDVSINQSRRRQVIHRYLAKSGLIRPEEMNGWLYKEVLHADLSDPYLGLKEYLDGPYPWADPV